MTNTIPAKTGWLWIKQGFYYFKQQPWGFASLFFIYLGAMFLLQKIPYLGQGVMVILLPMYSMAFLQGCKQVELGLQVKPLLLLYGFHPLHRTPLIQLGILYLLLALAVLFGSTLIDGGLLWKMFTLGGKEEVNRLTESGLMRIELAMLFALLLYVPISMAAWFAAPLITWQQMGIPKALFYSFVTSWRLMRAFLFFGLVWFLLAAIIPAILAGIIGNMLGDTQAGVVVVSPFLLILNIILHCSFYPIYQTAFPPPEDGGTL